MATGTIMPAPVFTGLDANGAPVADGRLYTYLAGTTTPATTYSDVGLTTPHANPIVLDSAGRATVFLTPGVSYKFLLQTSAGATVWTQDTISAVPTSASSLDVTGTAGSALTAGQVVYLADGSGGTTAGRWYLADADAVYSSALAPAVGIALATLAAGESGSIRIGGMVDGLAGLVAGAAYYVSATAGALTSTPPTNARPVGVATTATTLLVQPNPDLTYLQYGLVGFTKLTFDGQASDPAVSAAGDAVLEYNSTTDELRASLNGAAYQVLQLVLPSIAEGRLSLTSGTPVTTSDVTVATSVYYTPYRGTRVSLYDGTRWRLYTFTERTLSLSGLAADTNYDVFLYDNAGTLTLEAVAWTTSTFGGGARATAITTQDGVWVKAGATGRRYLGSFRTTGTIGQTEDSAQNRYLWNAYGRVARTLKRLESTATWTYNSSTVRQANGSTSNEVRLMCGLAEAALEVTLFAQGTGSTTTNRDGIGLGESSRTAFSANAVQTSFGVATDGPATWRFYQATVRSAPAAGAHYVAWLEVSANASTGTTWYGSNTAGNAVVQSGLVGHWFA